MLIRDQKANIEYIWECLHAWRECKAEHPLQDEVADDVWDEVCTAMAEIQEELGVVNEL